MFSSVQGMCSSNNNGPTDALKTLLEFDFLASWDDPDAEIECFCSGGLSSLPSIKKRKKYEQCTSKKYS